MRLHPFTLPNPIAPLHGVALVLCLVVFLLPATGSHAARPGIGGEIPIRIEIEDRAQLEDLTKIVSIDDARGLEVWAAATPEQLVRLHAAGFRWEVLASAKAKTAAMCPAGWEADPDRAWSCYPSYQQYTLLMQRFVAEHPGLCRLMDLGAGNNTVNPHHLWALVISDNPDLDEDEPEVLLTSSMHGDETTGFVLMLRLIDELLNGHGSDPDLTALVEETEIWINPLANPDGAYLGGDDNLSGAIRYYTTTTGEDSGVDPNRNFPDPSAGDHPDRSLWWWPETEAMMALAEERSFVLSVNFHDGVEVVNYPWDTWERRHPDDAWFRMLARAYADLAQADSPGGYMTDFEDGITNGYDWYQIRGGRQDFMTYFHGGREVTIELSHTKLLPAEALEDYWQWNRRALLDFITHAHEGIRGLVTNADGAPLAATVEVVGRDVPANGSFVRTDPAVGDYHRLLLPGTYDLRFRSAGYFRLEISGIPVVEGEATAVDAVLHPMPVRTLGRRLAPVVPEGKATFPARISHRVPSRGRRGAVHSGVFDPEVRSGSPVLSADGARAPRSRRSEESMP